MNEFDPDRKSILVIEDDKNLRTTEEKFFKKSGFNVVIAENGLEGLNKCNNQVFDAILCDITMPRMTGDQAIKHIRNSKLNSKTPIFVLSGQLDAEVINKIKGHVVKAFTKPTDLMAMITFIKETIEN